MNKFSIANDFSQYFAVKFANTKELKQEVFKIRHAVYSKELGWEPCNELKMESDEYDDTSYHCLLEHKRTKTYAGCVRLVVPPENNPKFLLPFEKHCMESIRLNLIDPSSLRRGSFGEGSRIAVLESFRRRANEKNKPFVVNGTDTDLIFSEREKRNFPKIAAGLFLSLLVMAEFCNHSSIFVMMEPKLKRLLHHFGFHFLQVGDEMDYHGQRAMFYLSSDKFRSGLNEDMLHLLKNIRSDLNAQISSIPQNNPFAKEESFV